MSASWEDLRERLRAGESVTVDEIAEALAAGPAPTDLPPVVAAPRQKRSRGRPRKWTDRDVRAIDTLCKRIRLFSEATTTDRETMTCAPMPWEEIYRRVARRLRDPMAGRSLQELLRRRRDRSPGMRAVRVPEADMLAVLQIDGDD